MADIILFQAKAKLDANQNLLDFISLCKKELNTFGETLPFDENVWDVTDYLNIKGHGNKRHRLVFSTLETVKEKQPLYMQEPFLSFAKSYIRYSQSVNPTLNIAFRVGALRALHTALSKNGDKPNPILIHAGVLNRAAQLISEHYSSQATANRVSGQLEAISTFLSTHNLTEVPLSWHNPIPRPTDTVRVGREFDKRRSEKMPTEATLEALPKIFCNATDTPDVLYSAIGAILLSSPVRIHELLILPVECEVFQKDKEGKEVYGLRWWPGKGASPMIKWVIPSMASVIQEAIRKVRNITSEARKIAAWYEQNPNSIYLPNELQHLRDQEWLSMKDVGVILGYQGRTAPNVWCKTYKVQQSKIGKLICAHFEDVQKVITSMLPKGFPYLDKEKGFLYSQSLFVVRKNELGMQRATYNCVIEAVTINQVNTALGGRSEHGFLSIFSRHKFTEPDGTPINLSTHQCRHYLNTLAQTGGLSQLDIAKWSGRKDIRQNSAYDHESADQLLDRIRNAIGDEQKIIGPLSVLPKRELIRRDELARIIAPTVHSTEIGYCIHDFAMTPCQHSAKCINCEDMVCVKGDELKTAALKAQLDEARQQLAQAEKAKAEGYFGSDRWLDYHSKMTERLTNLYSILTNPAIPNGQFIQLAREKDTLELGLANQIEEISKSFNPNSLIKTQSTEDDNEV